jgi:hypothetical protein
MGEEGPRVPLKMLDMGQFPSLGRVHTKLIKTKQKQNRNKTEAEQKQNK